MDTKAIRSALPWIIIAAVGAAIIKGFFLIFLPSPHTARQRQISANEDAVISSLRSIGVSEITCVAMSVATPPNKAHICSLKELSAQPSSSVDAELSDGTKYGYFYSITDLNRETPADQSSPLLFEIRAVPQTVGTTGKRGLCMNQDGVIKADLSGGTNCTEVIQ